METQQWRGMPTTISLVELMADLEESQDENGMVRWSDVDCGIMHRVIERLHEFEVGEAEDIAAVIRMGTEMELESRRVERRCDEILAKHSAVMRPMHRIGDSIETDAEGRAAWDEENGPMDTRCRTIEDMTLEIEGMLGTGVPMPMTEELIDTVKNLGVDPLDGENVEIMRVVVTVAFKEYERNRDIPRV